MNAVQCDFKQGGASLFKTPNSMQITKKIYIYDNAADTISFL